MPSLAELMSGAIGSGLKASEHAASSSGQRRDPLEDLLRYEQFKALQEERGLRSLRDVREEMQQTGVAQMQPAMQRLEKAAPGAFTGKTEFKSVGGLKNLIPNVLVSPAETVGLLPKGSAEERAAMQELANVKIYDQSGKQINEAEMRRIQDSMGLRGITDPNVIADSLKQAGYQVLSKQQQVTAGTKPSALERFRKAGGVGGYTTLEQLLGKGPGGQARTPASPAPIPKAPTTATKEIRVRLKSTGETGNLPENEFDPSLYDRL